MNLKGFVALALGFYVLIGFKYVGLVEETHVLKNRVAELEAQGDPIKVTLSHYTSSADECDNDPEHTALQEKPVPGITVAVSWDMMHLLGKWVYVSKGYGMRRVNDLLNPRYTKRVDILVSSKSEARQRGIIKDVEIAEIRDPNSRHLRYKI